MNENELHSLIRDWFRSEAPREAPDWVVQRAVDRAAELGRRTPAAGRVWMFQPLAAVLIMGLLLIAGLSALAALLPRPADPSPVPRATVVRDLALGPGTVLAVATDLDSIWLADSTLPGAVRLDPLTGERLLEVRTHRAQPARLDRHPLVSDVIVAFGSAWTVDDEFGTVTRIHPESGETLARVNVGRYPLTAIPAAGSIWVLRPLAGDLVRIDPITHRTRGIPLPGTATDGRGLLAGNERAIWVALDGFLYSVDPATAEVVDTISIGADVAGLAVGDSVWIATEFGLSRIDTTTGRLDRTVTLGGSPSAVAIAGGLVWVTDSREGTFRGVDPQTMSVVETVQVGRGAVDIGVAGSSMTVLNQVDSTVTLIQVAD